MSIPRRAVGRPVAVAMLFVAVVLLGLISFGRLPIDLLPDVAYPKLVIYTGYAGVGPSEVERFVTGPVEQQISRVPGVREVESVSREGVSLVTVRFVWGTDMDFAVLNVRERLQTLSDVLPGQADQPLVLRTDPRSEPVMVISVAGTGDLRALKDLAESVLRRRLEQIGGVAQVTVTGGSEREIQVDVDPGRAEAYGVTLDAVSEALAASNYGLPGGAVRSGGLSYHLRTLGEFQSIAQIGDVVVARGEPGGIPSGGVEGSAAPEAARVGPAVRQGAAGVVTLRDVATIRDGDQERTSMARYNGAEAVGLLLYKEPDANAVRVAREVERALGPLRREYRELRMDVAASQAGFISDAIANVVQALMLGGLLAFLVLFLFLRDARYPVAIALAIPISVAATFALLDLAGVSLNIMSLGGLAVGVGMLVDNSIVVLENIFRHRPVRAAGVVFDTLDSAASGAEEVQGAITASTLTTISVFVPIVYVKGMAGELFGALSLAVAFSLLASLAVALTLLPMLAARWRPTMDEHAASAPGRSRTARVAGGAAGGFVRPLLDAFDRAFDGFGERYHRLLIAALRHRRRVVVATLGLTGVAVAMACLLPRSALPEVDQGSFRVRIELPNGTPLDRTAGVVVRLEKSLRGLPGVDAVFSRVGRESALSGMDGRETGANTATVDVRLRAHAGAEEVVRRLRPALRRFPPGTVIVEKGQATALGRLMGGGEADVALRVRGEDEAAALRYAHRLERVLAGVPALENVRLGLGLGQPEVRVGIDRERAAAHGVDARAVAETVERSMLGRVATELVEFDRKVPIVVRLPERDRRSLGTLDRLSVAGVPLRELIHVTEALGPSEIQRRGQSRVVPVYADVARGGLGAAVEAIHAAVAREAPVPRGLGLEIGGESEEMTRSFRDLRFAFALALLLVYMILAAQFESFLHPLTIMMSVPLALIGAIAALWLTGSGLDTMSLIGMVILVGIAVNDAIVKVEFINQARGRGASVRAAILEAGRARLRPILMTTVTTVLGLLPMALGIGRGADLRAPLAIAVIGGLLTATALTLIVVPVAYDLAEDLRVRVLAWAGRPPGGEGV